MIIAGNLWQTGHTRRADAREPVRGAPPHLIAAPAPPGRRPAGRAAAAALSDRIPCDNRRPRPPTAVGAAFHHRTPERKNADKAAQQTPSARDDRGESVDPQADGEPQQS
ncbi:hypothetical protein GCM10009799_49380 [Nocardiopsis rhodophaea]|uniref:Uncharacterized protein n=1 Tax=Nocardiopsis rhodophaea TaxID=280238 RepID=A0ABN2TNT0_9ACTN